MTPVCRYVAKVRPEVGADFDVTVYADGDREAAVAVRNIIEAKHGVEKFEIAYLVPTSLVSPMSGKDVTVDGRR